MSANSIFQPALRAMSGASAYQCADTKVEESRDGSSITYTARGTLEQLCNVMRGVFEQFHPAGYSTRVESLKMEGFGDDSYVLKMWRARSCE